MNQFIIENPFLSILISYIIGAVVMNIILALAIHREVVKEVGKVLGEDDDKERIGLYPDKSSNAPELIIHSRVLPIWLCKDEGGFPYMYFEEPIKYEAGCGPDGAAVNGVYYRCESKGLYINFLMDSHHTIISELDNKLHRLDNVKYGVLKINLYDDDVVSLINVILEMKIR